jgi:hypothetical protein
MFSKTEGFKSGTSTQPDMKKPEEIVIESQGFVARPNAV